jgi:hypothetical protein
MVAYSLCLSFVLPIDFAIDLNQFGAECVPIDVCQFAPPQNGLKV